MKCNKMFSIRKRGISYQMASLNHLEGIASMNRIDSIHTISPNWIRIYGFIYITNRITISRNYVSIRETGGYNTPSIIIRGCGIPRKSLSNKIRKHSIENFEKYYYRKLRKRKKV